MSNEKPKVRAILGLVMGLLLSAMDQTIISTAMPNIVKDLGGLSLYSWVFSAYMLTSTTFIPIFGKLADLYGRRTMYLAGMFIFLAGSVLCGLAPNMQALIVFRGIQGIGGGGLLPLAFTIIGDILPPERRGKLQGLFGAVFALSSILGPTIGGAISEYWHWRWIFYMNLPLGIAAFALIAAALPASKARAKPSIDWLGAIALSGAIVSFLLGLVIGGGRDGSESSALRSAWTSPQAVGLFAAGAFLIALFLWIESKAKEPIIPLHLYRNRTFALTSAIAFLLGVGMYSMILYIPLLARGVIGVRPSVAGYILTPMMLSVSIGSTISGRLISKVPFRALMAPGMALMATGFILMSQISVYTSNWEIIVYMIVTGLGMGPLMPAITIASQTAVGPSMRGIGTSLAQFFRTIGGVVGTSAIGGLLFQRMKSGLSGLGKELPAIPADQLDQFSNPQLLLNTSARASLPHDVLVGLQNVFAHALRGVFLTGFVIVAAGFVVCLFLGNARVPKHSSLFQAGHGERSENESQ